MKKWLKHFWEVGRCQRALWFGVLALLLAGWSAGVLCAAPFDRQIQFTQPDGTVIQLHGRGDEFSAVFETLDGYTVVFDPGLRAYCYAQLAADGSLISSGYQAHLSSPATLGLTPHLRMSADVRRRQIVERWQRWEAGMQIRERWAAQKAAARRYYDRKGPQFEPPPFTTTGLKVGLTLLIDFSDDPATVPQAEIVNFLNGDNYTGFGNNGSVKSYFWDNSGGLLLYTNVVTIYIRVPNPKTTYNDITQDAGNNANRLIKDALDTLKALPEYNTQILPTFSALTVDQNNQVVACNVFYAGGNGGVWTMGLWPHSWALYIVGAQPLGNGMSVFRYQITNIGNELEIGTFCHENGHMLCGYPDIYDYDFDSTGGAGMFCLMNSGNFGGRGKNPTQICAYLKRASGWATTTELDGDSSLIATLTASPGTNFNHFYRFEKPGVPTEYYLAENRQQAWRDADIPGSGILIWHVDELGDHNNQSTNYNTVHANYEVSLVQADNQFHLQRNLNEGDARDPFYEGNPSPGYANEFSDTTAPSARWWDGTESGLLFAEFSPSADTMTFRVGLGLPIPRIVTWEITGGNGNGIIDPNECNNLFVILTNRTQLGASGIQVTLSTLTPGVGFGVRTVNYPDMPPGSAATNAVPFTLSTAPEFLCGTPIELTVLIKSDQATVTNTLLLPTGTAGTPMRFDNFVPVVIPDNNPAGTNSVILVSNVTTAVRKVVVSLHITHSFDSDLKLELIGPDGTRATLADMRGGSGDNYGISCSPDTARTTFDDDAATPIGNATAPFAGTFQPDQPLAVFAGKFGPEVNGPWRLRVVDQAALDVGMLRCWSLFISPAECTDGGGTCPGVDVGLGIRDNPDPVFVGSNLVYSITVTNFGPSPASNVVVQMPLPPTVVFVSASASQGTASEVAGTVVANLGQMPFAGRATVTVTVRPLVTGLLSATATVSSKDPDPNTANNSATATTTVTPPAADLALGLADAPDPTIVGGLLTYTVSLTNHGPAVATGVAVTNVLPLSVNIGSVSPSQGTMSISGNTVVWNVGALAVDARATASINVTPTAPGTLVATATARALQADPLPGNNSATATTVVGPAADLVVTFTDAPDPVVVGSNWVYTVTVTNLGPNDASSAVLNVTLPAGVQIVGTNTTQGALALSGNTLTGNLGALPVGSGAVVTVVLNSTNAGVFNASATAAAAQADPNPANNTAGQSTTVAAPFVNIVAAGATLTAESLSPPNGTVDVGETVTVTLRLRNAGNVPNTNLVATLLATNGVTSPGGPQTYGVLSGGGLPVGRAFTFTAAGTNGGTVIATLRLQDGPNDLGTVTFTFALPRVQTFANTTPITIPDAGAASPYPSTITVSGVTGMVGRVTVTLSNLTHTFVEDVDVLLVGPTGQKAVILSDAGNPNAVANINVTLDDAAATALPDNGQILSGAYRPADYEPGDTFNPPAPVGPYASALSVFANQNPNGLWSLYVMDDAAGDAGNIGGGWSLSIYTITPVNQLADVGIGASASPNPVVLGEPITYTFTVTNFGPSTATGLAFTNLLPAGLTLVSAGASQGSVMTNSNSVVVNLGTLNTAAVATVTVVARANLAGPITNTATIALSETDPNPANNTASAVTTVRLPVADVELVKLADPEVVLGSNVNFIVTVTNLGPETALNVVVSDPLPAGLTFVSALTTAGSVTTNDAGAVIATLGNLAPGEGALITIKATADTLGWITNTASAATASHDTNTLNNAAVALTQVLPPSPHIVAAGARLLAETVTNAALDIGETVTVEFSLQNIGSADATNLVASLQSGGGVTDPSGPQNYGLLAAGGAAVARPFTFTANGTNGGVVIAALRLEDGTNDLGTVRFFFNLPGRATFANTNAISIPDHGVATPYPSTIVVSGLTGLVSRLSVNLHGLTHAFPDDLDLLLVGPTGQKLVIMSDAGGGRPVTNVTLTLEDAAAAPLPDSGQILSGSYQPADYEAGDTFPPPAPSGGSGGPLSLFNGSEPNGIWALYVVDDATGDPGGISGGWSLTIETLSTINPVADLAISLSDAPDPLYVGSGLDYTILVTNLGPASATGVTVTNLLPAGMTYISGAASQGSVGAVGDLVTANLGNIAVGDAATLTIHVATSLGGVHLSTAGVFANETDLNPANNLAQTSTTVRVPLPAQLAEVALTNGQVQATFRGEPGQTYVIQASTNLLDWVPVATNTLPGSGTAKFTDPDAPAFGYRFYRAVRLIP